MIRKKETIHLLLLCFLMLAPAKRLRAGFLGNICKSSYQWICKHKGPVISGTVFTTLTIGLVVYLRKTIDDYDKSGYTKLINSVRSSNSYLVWFYLKICGADPNIADNDNQTPLYWAASEGHTEIVKSLLKSGANPNIADNNNQTPLYWAASEGHTEIVKSLLESGADPNIAAKKCNQTPLFCAALRGHTETVKSLLKSGANPNITDNKNQAPLHWAALNGTTKLPNPFLNLVPTQTSLQKNVTKLLYVVLRFAATLRLSNPFLNLVPTLILPITITKLLSIGLQVKATLIFRSLLKSGANPNIADNNNQTPLYWAASEGHTEIVKSLLKSGANPNIANNKKQTPLYLAALRGYTEIVRSLLESDADPNITNTGIAMFNTDIENLIARCKKKWAKYKELIEKKDPTLEKIKSFYGCEFHKNQIILNGLSHNPKNFVDIDILKQIKFLDRTILQNSKALEIIVPKQEHIKEKRIINFLGKDTYKKINLTLFASVFYSVPEAIPHIIANIENLYGITKTSDLFIAKIKKRINPCALELAKKRGMKNWHNKFWCLLWKVSVANRSSLTPVPEINAHIIGFYGLPEFTIKKILDSNKKS